MAIIDKIKLSGQTFEIQDSNASKTVELTQAEYDALVTKDPNTYYIITDATPIDIANYYTKTETDDLLDDKLDVTAYTPTDLSNYYTKSETSGATQIQTALNGKADSSTVNSLNNVVTAHTASTTVHVTSNEKATWNSKSDFSGNYNDLTNKPTIPTVPTNVSDFTNDAGYITSNDISGKQDVSGMTAYTSTATTNALNNALTAHTANTTVHVTASEKSTWNSKSDFSGNYNDLSNKPTIPTSASQLTNDSGYITSSALNGYATEDYVTAATSDMATKTWVGQQGYLTQHQDISGKQDVSGMTAYTETSAFTAHTADTTIHVTAQDKTNWNAKSDFSGDYNDLTNKLSAGTNITIVDNVISAEGGGKAVSGGTNISITTGETADTINCTLPITATSSAFNTISVGTGSGGGSYNTLIGTNARCDNNYGHNVFLVAQNSSSSSEGAYVNGTHNVIIGAIKGGYPNFNIQSFNTSRSVVIGGGGISTDKDNSVAIGYQANVSGTTKTNINNQLTIDTSNQVYIYNKDNTEMICLQDQLGGGGSSYTAGDGIDITNDVISVTGKADTSAVTEVSDALTAHTADTNVHTSAAEKSSWNGAVTNASNAVTALGGLSLVKLTQAEYDALATKDSNTLYVING